MSHEEGRDLQITCTGRGAYHVAGVYIGNVEWKPSMRHGPHFPPPVKAGTVLAFDFGERRIGMAVGDTAIGIAHPLATIGAADKRRRYAAIRELVLEWQPSFLVVGLPSHMDGTEHGVSRLARKFAHELGSQFSLPVELVDERLTSVEAEASMISAGASVRKRKLLVDQVAAQHILQSYLDSRSRTP